MMRASVLILILGPLVVTACEPGRCLRHSDCPALATCKRGVCRLPPKQSTSQAQPAQQQNQSVAPTESTGEDSEQNTLDADASAESTSAPTATSTNASSALSATTNDSFTDESVSSLDGEPIDGGAPTDAGAALDAATVDAGLGLDSTGATEDTSSYSGTAF
jgi:outer membrane biosynthesis protein TonB